MIPIIPLNVNSSDFLGSWKYMTHGFHPWRKSAGILIWIKQVWSCSDFFQSTGWNADKWILVIVVDYTNAFWKFTSLYRISHFHFINICECSYILKMCTDAYHKQNVKKNSTSHFISSTTRPHCLWPGPKANL